ncbi:MAG: hypothetical protein AB7V16_13460, partial [Vulcanibacillus sp.]
MKKTISKFGILLLLFGVFFVISGCNAFNQGSKITSIAIDLDSVEESYDVDTFNIRSILLKVFYYDSSILIIPVEESMISDEHKTLLTTSGTHLITINYENFTTNVTINLVENTLKKQLLSIYNLATTQGEFVGTYEEWLESIKGDDGLSIVSATIDTSGHLILTLSDDSIIDAGQVVPDKAKEVEFQAGENQIQWRYIGDTEWKDLVSLVELIGEPGIDGREVLFQVADNYIQWKYEDETVWNNLISLTTLTGAKGDQGDPGIDGREVLFQVADNFIQWKYEDETVWNNLISLTTLTGAKGDQGDPGIDGREVLFQVADNYIQWKY